MKVSETFNLGRGGGGRGWGGSVWGGRGEGKWGGSGGWVGRDSGDLIHI